MSTTPGTPSKARGQLKKILSQVSITAHLHVLRPSTVPDADLPPPPPLSLSPYQLVSGTNPSIAAAAAASGGGLASDEINLKLPLHETSLGVIKPLLEFLMTCYAVEMVRETRACEQAHSGALRVGDWRKENSWFDYKLFLSSFLPPAPRTPKRACSQARQTEIFNCRIDLGPGGSLTVFFKKKKNTCSLDIEE